MDTVDQVELDYIAAQAEAAGMSPHSVGLIQSVWFTICSGDVELPWSQEVVEEAFVPLNVPAVINLLLAAPDFLQKAIDYHNFHG